MTEIRRLDPHAPVPESGRFVLVIRRFGEDDPSVTLTEVIWSDGKGPPVATPAVREDSRRMSFDEAIAAGRERAEREGIAVVHAVDRAAGVRERDILSHGGDHTVGIDRLVDSQDEDTDAGRAADPGKEG